MKSSFSFLLVLAGLFAFSPVATAQEEMPETTTEEMPADAVEEAAPAMEGTIGETVANNEQTATLTAALDAAGLTSALEEDGSFILLAPTEEAFASLPEGVLDALLQPENANTLVTILQYHLVNGADEASTTTMQTVLEDEQVTLGENLNASNGVVYLINQVLVPADVDLSSLQSGN